MKSENYSDIGALFVRARAEMRITLLQASQALHIRARYLEALENGHLEGLPGAAYTKGYLQAYAVFLRLDKDEILRRFEQVEQAQPLRGFYFPKVFSQEKAPANQVVWGGLAFAMVVYIAWLIAFKPHAVELSVIQPPSATSMAYAEKSQQSMLLSNVNLRDVACVREPKGLYPPCYRERMVPEIEYSLLPLHRQKLTVMELAQ